MSGRLIRAKALQGRAGFIPGLAGGSLVLLPLPWAAALSGMWHAASSGTGYPGLPGGLPACELIGPHGPRVSTANAANRIVIDFEKYLSPVELPYGIEP
jgi:hypothetical protein